MKKEVFAVFLAFLMLGMAACGAAETEKESSISEECSISEESAICWESSISEESAISEETIGQLMYDGTLYGITDETTAIAFSEEDTFTELLAIPSGQVPKNDGDCNLDAQELQLYDGGDCYVVIADGTQYIIKK